MRKGYKWFMTSRGVQVMLHEWWVGGGTWYVTIGNGVGQKIPYNIYNHVSQLRGTGNAIIRGELHAILSSGDFRQI